MKTKFKIRTMMIAMMIMVLGMSSISVSAATIAEDGAAKELAAKTSYVETTTELLATRSNTYPYPSSSSSLYVSSSNWATVASSTTGFNCNVVVSGLVVGNYYMDVRMLDKNFNVVWSQQNAFSTIGGNGGSRTFWCGSNVYYIQVKGHNGNGIAWAYQA